MKWRKPLGKCGESSHCPEVCWDGRKQRIGIRNSETPTVVTWFSYAEWVMIRNDPGFSVMKDA